MNLFIIENNLLEVQKYLEAGVDTIFIDLEQLGKEIRQKNLDSVKSKHHVDDIKLIKTKSNAKVLVRVDPINPKSRDQINKCIDNGADEILLPYFTKRKEVEDFMNIVGGRIKSGLLFEHIEALNDYKFIISQFKPEYVHLGLNDLSLSLKLKFMFSSLFHEGVEDFCSYCHFSELKFGIGGIGPLRGSGLINGEKILLEYIRLGASSTILSRSFKNKFKSTEELREEISKIKKVYTSKPKDEKLKVNYLQLKSQCQKIEKLV